MSDSSIKVFIDRIEGDLAVVVLSEDDSVKFNLPAKYLPDGAGEGTHLRLSFKVDEASRKKETDRIDSLLKKLASKKRDE
jgi:hypothetical protein